MTEKTEVVEEAVEPTPEEALAMTSDEERARIVQILEMGLVTDMISIKGGDPNKRYVYVRERDVDVQKFKLLGYKMEKAEKGDEHATPEGYKRVGDTLLMSVDRARYDLIQEVSAERKKKRWEQPSDEYKNRAALAAQRGEAAQPLDLMENS